MAKQTSDSDTSGPYFELSMVCQASWSVDPVEFESNLNLVTEFSLPYSVGTKKPVIYLNYRGIKVLRHVVCFMFQAPRFHENEEEKAMQQGFTNDAIQPKTI